MFDNQLRQKLETISLNVTMLGSFKDTDVHSVYDALGAFASDMDKIGCVGVSSIIEESKRVALSQPEEDRAKSIFFTIDFLSASMNEWEKTGGYTIDVAQFKNEIAVRNGAPPVAIVNFEKNSVLLDEFIDQTKIVLQEAEEIVLWLEDHGREAEKILALFRQFHTLKSEANVLGLIALGSAFHGIEDLLEQINTASSSLEKTVIEFLLNSIDAFQQFIVVLRDDPLKASTVTFQDIHDTLAQLLHPEDTTSSRPAEPEHKENVIVAQQGSEDAFTPTVPRIDLSEGTEIIEEFFHEATEHLAISEESILVLESDPENMEEVNKIFRAFHTIKGVTGFLNLRDMKMLAHTSETMLDAVRSGKRPFDNSIADATLQSIDLMRHLLTFLLAQYEQGGDASDNEYVNIGSHLARLQTIIDSAPVPSDMHSAPLGEIMIEQGMITQDELDAALSEQRTGGDEMRVGEILIANDAVSKKDVNAALALQSHKVGASIKVNLSKVDELVDLVGELVINQSQVVSHPIVNNDSQARLRKNVAEMGRILRQLQGTSMGMRLVPIKATFQKMVRIVRDIAKNTGKLINVVLEGEETEIDKNMVELVSDPLIHMVRNAVDHGIEPPQVRSKQGKNQTGTIVLGAYQKGNSILIKIRDDGAGLKKEKILEKAMEKGLVGAHEQLPDKRIWHLIFEPGFSTAEAVTDVSGRGVGMDVVRRNIEQLRGRIDIESIAEKGTIFSIALPVTLAIVEAIVVGVAHERYVLPIHSVLEFSVMELQRITYISNDIQIYRFGQEMYEIIYLDRVFNINRQRKELDARTICVFESDYGKFCLVVDEILFQQQVVIKSLGDRMQHIQGVSGGAILGDGRIGLILDPNGLVKRHRTRYVETE